jgi:hypothetical protein
MKTNIFFLAIALISSLVIFSSCESKSGKRVREIEKVEKVATQKTDTLLFSPEKIGVTELIKEFTPYPKYDGGTGMDVSFSIGIQHKEKTYQVDVRRGQFFSEDITREKAENDPAISDLVLAHYLASKTPKDYIDVVVIKGEVVKLTRRSAFIADELYPTALIWVKK